MRKIKIAQIGISNWGHGSQVFGSLSKQKDIFDIAGYVLPENEREKFPELIKHFDGYKELTLDEALNNPEIEAVAVECEEINLTKYATLAAQHNKHIHMEKPGGTSLEDFEKMIQEVKNGGKVFHTGYMYRYNPYVKQIMNEIKSGELGEIISVEAQMSCNQIAEVRRWLGGFKGGMMFWLGCHLVDLVLQIKGVPDKVTAYNRSTGLDGIAGEDYGMAIFEYKNGVSFIKTNAMEIGGFNRRQLVITGSKKTIEVKPFEVWEGDGQYSAVTEYTDLNWNSFGTKARTENYDRYDEMMSSFAAMVRGEKDNPWSLDYELLLYKHILLACGVEVDI